MSESPSQNLRADNLGRFVLDLHTPAERTIGRMFGCFTWLSGIIALTLFSSVMGGDFGILSKLLRIAGLVMVVGFFYRCRRDIDCYYLLDNVGGQLLYHFSAIMIVSEDPVANLEDVAGIGVSYTGKKISLGTGSWAVFFCLSDGNLIRVSDFLGHTDKANAIATEIAELIKVSLLTCDHGSRKVVAVENGQMIQKTDDSFVSSISKDNATGCLMAIFIIPYAFWPTLIVLFLAFSIASGSGEDLSIEYFREQRDYGYIEADGTLLPQLDKRRKRTTAESTENSASAVASGTIVPGKGIIGLICIGEEMSAVLTRFDLPVPHVDFPEKTGYIKHLNKHVAKPKFRQDIQDGAISIEFTGDSSKKMRVSRIEIFRRKELPYKTQDMIGFGESAKKLFNLGDGIVGPDSDEGYKYQAANPGASFFASGKNYRASLESEKDGPEKKQFGLAFAEQGITYLFDGDRLIEIAITEGKLRYDE